MSSFRRTCVVLLGVAALSGLTLVSPALAQRVPVQQLQLDGIDFPPPGTGSDFGQAISLPTDPKLERSLQAAVDNIKAENWTKVVEVLQMLLNVAEDKFVQVERTANDGKTSKVWVSVRKESNRLIGTLPKDGLETYKLAYGNDAKTALAEGKQRNDFRKIADVAHRYLYTDAGAEAMLLVASNTLDRGDFVAAALYFERLLEREDLPKLSGTTLLKAALALQRFKDANSVKLQTKVWDALKEKVGTSMRLGDKVIELADLRVEVEKYKDTSLAGSKYDWFVFRGNAARSAAADGGAPFLISRWKLGTIKEGELSSSKTVQTAITNAVNSNNQRGGIVIPAASPIAADGKLVYRATDGIYAVDLKTGELRWHTAENSKWSLTRVAYEGSKWGTFNQWQAQFAGAGRANILFENSTLGTLSTDNANVYAIEDLPVPPFVHQQQYQQQQNYYPSEDLRKAVNGSRLQAYSLKSGKLLWELGATDGKTKEETELGETFFLGPPLPIYGKLYALAEKKEEMRLLCIDPAKGEVNWSQSLATTNLPILKDPVRRTHAAHLSYGEGILVCPTNSGAILGVDMLTHSLVWAYSYRAQQPASPNQPMQPGGGFKPVMPIGPGGINPNQGVRTPRFDEWKVSAPVITDGKVIFTAFDAGGIHCLNLRDGSEVWKKEKKEDDVYLGGVHNNKVVLVGRKACRALDLATGNQVWEKATGTPSGMGVIAENTFYLPLKTVAGKDAEPEVCQIDIDSGNVVHAKSRKKVVPGNLLFYDGDVLSQSLEEVAAFPQLKVKLADMNATLANNPEDPKGLTDRGEVNLDSGDREAAVADLSKALANKPDDAVKARASEALYDCLTDYLQNDFAKAERYINLYEPLCRVAPAADATPQEKQTAASDEKRRLATMYSLIGKGREDQGQVLEAFDAYLSFGSLGVQSNEQMSVVYDSSIRAPLDVLARAQLTTLMAKAVEKGLQKPLEERIAARWNKIRQNDVDGIRGFVGLFGAQSNVGRQARLQLAERLMKEDGTSSLVEAEQHLLLLRGQKDDSQLAAQAVEALARLMARKSQMRDAAYYYKVLADDYGKVMVRDDKTGEDFFNELVTDKRFWGHLEEGTQSWHGAKVKAKPEHGNFPQQRQTLTFEPAGEVTPFFQRHQIALEPTTSQLRVTDRVTGDNYWTTTLTGANEVANFMNFIPQNMGPRFSYHIMGHMIVLPIAHRVYGLDLVNKRVIWDRNLLGDGAQMVAGSRLQPDVADGTISIVFQDGYIQPLGKVGPIEPSYVCIQSRDALTAIDPISGRTLWTRNDVTSRAMLFGDDQMIYVVEMSKDKVPTGTRALRAHDGASLPAPDFTAIFQQRQRIIGRTVLVSENKADKTVLRLHDVLTGKDIWTKDFPTGSTILKSEEPNLVGGIDPQGKVTVFDLRTRKEVIQTQVDPALIAKNQFVTLLEDQTQYYLAVQMPLNQQMVNMGGVRSNFVNNSGVRCVPINGKLFAFGKDGTFHWNVDAPNQMVVLESFDDLPFVLFSCQGVKMMGNAQQGQWAAQVGAVKVVDKKTGKLIHDDPEMNPNNPQQFYSFNIDLKTGKLELISWGFKLTLTMELDTAAATEKK